MLHCASMENRVNCWNISGLLYGDNQQPSQGGNIPEGSETRGRGYGESYASNAPTSALPEREDIVRAAWRHAEAEHKQFRDNTTDEVLDTTPQDNLTSCFYSWKQIAGSIAINRLEERQNSGEAQILSLMQQKVSELQMSMSDEVNRQLLGAFSAGNGGKDLTPLPLIIADLPSSGAGATVGSISGATNSWWRNETTDSSATTTKAYKDELRKMWNDCSKGPGGGPDVVLLDQLSYEHYESALDDHTRHTNTAMADLGFDNLRLKGATCFWDERVPDSENQVVSEADGGAPTAGTAYFANSRFLELVVDTQTDFITTPFVRWIRKIWAHLRDCLDQTCGVLVPAV